MTPMTKEDALSFIEGLTMAETATLVKELEERWGVSAQPTAGVVLQNATPQNAPAAEEQTEFTVTLETVPADKKIAAIKVVRQLTGLGLSEAKAFVESAPKVVKEGVSKDEAQKIRSQLEAEGAKVAVT